VGRPSESKEYIQIPRYLAQSKRVRILQQPGSLAATPKIQITWWYQHELLYFCCARSVLPLSDGCGEMAPFMTGAAKASGMTESELTFGLNAIIT